MSRRPRPASSTPSTRIGGRSAVSAAGPPCRRSPTTCRWPSSRCRPPPCRGVVEDCIAARVRGAIVVTAVDGTDVDMPALVHRARSYGMRIIGPGSMGVAASRAEIGLQASLVPVTLPPGAIAISLQSGSLGASAAAPGRSARHRSVVVRLPRRQERHLRQRPPAVLGGRRDDPSDRDVHRVLRQPAQVRPHRPPGVAATPDRRGAHGRGGDRAVRECAVPAGRADRSADRRRTAGHGQGAGHPTRARRAQRRRPRELAQSRDAGPSRAHDRRARPRRRTLVARLARHPRELWGRPAGRAGVPARRRGPRPARAAAGAGRGRTRRRDRQPRRRRRPSPWWR